MSTTEQDRRILHTLATADPDFTAFQATFPAEQNPANLDPEILQDTLAVLNQDPQQAATVQALCNQPTTSKSFVTGTEVATRLSKFPSNSYYNSPLFGFSSWLKKACRLFRIV